MNDKNNIEEANEKVIAFAEAVGNQSAHKNLATIQRIKSLEPIEGADRIELAKFEDIFWQCVVKKGEFKVNDLAIYVQIDTVLPDAPWSQFLKDVHRPEKPIRIKSKKLKGVLSQGIAFPISILDGYATENEVVAREQGLDVTSILGVIHYEKPVAGGGGNMMPRGNFPSFLRKTDEERVQNAPKILEELQGKQVYGSLKMDGSSFTAYKIKKESPESEGGTSTIVEEFGICSRNLNLKDVEGNKYWEIAKQYDLPTKLPVGYAVQAELCGPSIQGNKIGLVKNELYLFNVWNIEEQRYLGFEELTNFSILLQIPIVPITYFGIFNFATVEELLNFSDSQKYENGKQAEGVVWRTVEEQFSAVLQGRTSFKVISNKFLLENGE